MFLTSTAPHPTSTFVQPIKPRRVREKVLRAPASAAAARMKAAARLAAGARLVAGRLAAEAQQVDAAREARPLAAKFELPRRAGTALAESACAPALRPAGAEAPISWAAGSARKACRKPRPWQRRGKFAPDWPLVARPWPLASRSLAP